MVGVCYFIVFIYLWESVYTHKNKECPEICMCLASYVNCASRKLVTVPSNLPKWTGSLHLHNNVIRNLDDAVWKNLTDLKEIKLNKNNISSIPKEAFIYQKKLQILELNRNRLTTIQALAFQSLQHLSILKLKKNRLTQLLDGAFYGLKNIDKLMLDYNSIQTITKGWLYGLNSLKELSVSHNNINRIEIGAWESCNLLTELDLSFNVLGSIQADTFKYLGNLKKLNLNNNNLNFMEEHAFTSLTNLKILHLSDNKISWAIEDASGVFQSLTKLEIFNLASNSIKSINQYAFTGLNSLLQLNLTNNNISSVEDNAFDSMPQLTNLWLNSSSFLCDSNLQWFSTWLQEHTFQVSTICAFPPELEGKSLQKVDVSNFIIEVLPKPRLLKDLDPEIMALKGENISLHCLARSNSGARMTFQWKKDNVEVPASTFTNLRTESTDDEALDIASELNLTSVRNTDGGKYQCIVSNKFGTTYSQKASISVLVFPEFLKTPSNVTIKPGETAKLECSAHGEPQPEIAWQKDGGNDFPAARERRMHVMPEDDVFFILDVKPSDMGVYSCTAHNAAGTVIANARLDVQQEPSFVSSMENTEVTAGESVVLKCKAAGTPKPTIRWLKDSEPITPTERHFFTAEDQLMVIVDTVQNDSGDYQCHLNNSLGERTASSQLTVKPSALNPRDMLGILIIAVVCCAVVTSLVWVVIIYQTRLRIPSTQSSEPASFTLPKHFSDDASDRSSCKDSGTGDSAKRSSDDLAPDDFDLVIERPPVADTHTPLLHYSRSTNHDRSELSQPSPTLTSQPLDSH